MRVTLRDIAQRVGVSEATVSLVLNDKPCRVSQATRDAILDIAEELHYHPNQAARALVTRRSQTIGLVVPDIANPFFAELAKAIEREARDNGYSVIFTNSDWNEENDVQNVSVLLGKQVDGIIISISNGEDANSADRLAGMLQRSGLPVVVLDDPLPRILKCDSVSLDNHAGGMAATQHLLELGHTRIGCVTGPLSSYSARERHTGYIDALRAAGIEPSDGDVALGDFRMPSGVTAGRALIERGVRAIFACNDLMACGVYREAMRQGLRVGRDVSIVGYDDIDMCQMLEHPLTTIRQPLTQMGQHASKLLIANIEDDSLVRNSMRFLPSLVVRDTTAPPR